MTNPRRPSRLASALIALATLAPLTPFRACAQVDVGDSTRIGDELRKLNVESFDYVWTTVKDRHWDPALGGVDWDKAKTELRPVVENAKTQGEARAAMRALLERLGASHFGILGSEEYDDNAGGPGSSGMDVRVIDGQALVVAVHQGTPAAEAGVRAGAVVKSVNGKEVAARLAKVKTTYEKSALQAAELSIAAQAMVSGEVGDTLDLEMAEGKDGTVTRRVGLEKPGGTPANFGHLPTMYLRIDSRKLPENVQYFGFSIFLDPPRLMDEFAKAVKAAKDTDGLIIDLRGNPGGIGALAMGMGGWLVSEPDQKLGTMHSRSATIKFVLNPRLDGYRGPVAVLVDGLSMSTSEILAGGLKDIGRARLFGQKTPGAALPSMIELLPNGDRFQFAVASYTSAGGKSLEGLGVEPDETVIPDTAVLLSGTDPTLAAAVKWTKSQARPGSAAAPAGATTTGIEKESTK